MGGSWVNIQSRGLEEVTLLAAFGEIILTVSVSQTCNQRGYVFYIPLSYQEQNNWKQNRYNINVILETTI